MKVFGRDIQDIDDLIRWAPLTPPWHVSDLARWVEQEVERTVTFQPWPEVAGRRRVSCTLLVKTATELRIFYEGDRSDRHQRLQAGHEFGHIMGGHLGLEVGEETELGGGVDSLMGPLDLWTLQYVLGSRSAAVTAKEELERVSNPTKRAGRHPYYSAQQEASAEILGTKLAVCMRGSITTARSTATSQGAAFVERLRQ